MAGIINSGYQNHSAKELEAAVLNIEKKMEMILADEKKAVSEYGKFRDEIGRTLELIPKTEYEKYRYIYAAMKGIEASQIDETKHHDKLINLIKAMKELQRTLGLERTTGRKQVLKPLERV